MPPKSFRRVALKIVVFGLSIGLAGGLSTATLAEATPTVAVAKKSTKINAVVASFDPYVGGEQRFVVGLPANDNRALAHGEVQFSFGFAGTREAPAKKVVTTMVVKAKFLPVAGQSLGRMPKSARLVSPSKVRGVYGAKVANFDKAGLWAVLVKGKDGKRPFSAKAVFEVAAAPQVYAVGDAAPRTKNALPGDAGVRNAAIDSRAEDRPIPDSVLHAVSVDTAIAARRPVMVVVSTPVYCSSRFCGPITDAIEKVARKYNKQMSFVHLEVWNDFENQMVNESASQWVSRRDGGNANEPWVFVVDRDGKISDRFDNVVSDAELRDAVERQIAASGVG